MIRHGLFLAALLTGTACSAEPQPPLQSSQATAAKPVVPRTLPRDAPDTGLADTPATAGRANRPQTPPPFAMTKLGQFDEPFSIALLPGGEALVTEKAGTLKLRMADGRIGVVSGVPRVSVGGQGGLLDVAPAPDFATSRRIYLTYAQPGAGAGELALARASLDWIATLQCRKAPCSQAGIGSGSLSDVQVLWRSGSDGPGGQFGAIVTFAPDGKSLFLSSGERQRFVPAQDPEQRLGKILHLTLDGKAWPGNPQYDAGGARAETWSTGHRNPYGLVFASDGRLWEVEMGPRGGDELNLILPGRNYGWPIVSNGDNYSGKPIPDHPSRPDLEAPRLWLNPSMSPGGMLYYTGAMFPEYRGDLFIAALSDESLIRVTLDGDRATPADQWAMGARIRDVAQAPDGAIWVLQDDGALMRLAKKR